MKTIFTFKALLLGVVICFNASFLNAQTLKWATRKGTSLGAADKANAVLVDANNNAFVGGADAVTSGNGEDMIIVKYNSSGTQQWATTYNGAGNGNDEVKAIAQDGSGNTYVTGFAYVTSTDIDIVTIKYNTSGVQQWVATYGTSSTWDYGYGIAVSGAGWVYVVGKYNNDAVIIKYNSSGTQQWATTYNGAGSSDDWFNDITLASGGGTPSDGNIYVCGAATQSNSTTDALIVKYNTSGTQQWVVTYNGSQSSNDELYNIKRDVNEYIYTAGVVYNSSTSQDGLLLRHNSSGTQQWAVNYNGGCSNGLDGFNDVALSSYTASNPDVYVTGFVWKSGCSIHDQDYTTNKYNVSGTLQWATTYNGPGDGLGNSNDVAVDVEYSTNTGLVFVTGYSQSTNKYDFTTLQYNASTGAQAWSATYDYSAHKNDDPLTHHALALGYNSCYGKDMIYVTGESETTTGDDDMVTLEYDAISGPPPCRLGNFNTQETASSSEQVQYGLYPNPFNDIATLNISSESAITNGTLKIYDLFSNLISTVPNISTNHIVIQKGNFPAGIYFYQVTENENSLATGKMIIQ